MVRIQDHIAKISWTVADKVLFLLYGFVNIIQNNALSPQELGLYTLCNALQTFIFAVSDGFILQAVIVRGTDVEARGSINRFVITWHIALALGASLLVLLLQAPFAWLLNEPRLTTVAAYLPLFCLLGIPRTLCLKYLMRDVQAREIFTVNAVWIGTMIAITAWMLVFGLLVSFEAMFVIAASGMGASSAVALWITRKQLSWEGSKHIPMRELFHAGVLQGMASLLGNMVRQLDVTVVQFFFGTATVGVYQSAKTLFRFFDEGFSAITSLVYPATMRLIHEERLTELLAMLSKMLSFSLLATLVMLFLTEIGVAEFVISRLLSAKYANAVGYFRFLVFAAPAMPFVALLPVMLALNEVRRLLVFIIVAVLSGWTVLAFVGVFRQPMLAPLGFVTYTVTLGLLIFTFVRSRLHLPMRLLVRAVPDTLDFLGLLKRKDA
ncbi:MAG: oligosaccharide flippase family protein [Candidatus Kapabacteria bacterium]|nr:oligosaccharide flippase family protein [Candidatus Kapabacteria bacterium]